MRERERTSRKQSGITKVKNVRAVIQSKTVVAPNFSAIGPATASPRGAIASEPKAS